MLIENSHKKYPPNISEFVVLAMVEFNKISSNIQFDFLTKLSGYKIIPKIVIRSTCEKLRNEPQLKKQFRENQMIFRYYVKLKHFDKTLGKSAYWQL